MRQRHARIEKSFSKSSKKTDSTADGPFAAAKAAGATDIRVGTVVRAHGVRGAVAVRTDSAAVGVLYPGLRVRAAGAGNASRTLGIRAVRAYPGGVVLSFREISERDAAQALAGAELHIQRGALPDPGENAYYACDLIGLAVRSPAGTRMGTLIEIVSTAANDVWVVRGDGGEILVPAIAGAVIHVDTQAGYIIVDPRTAVEQS